jgi:hypothetical protein
VTRDSDKIARIRKAVEGLDVQITTTTVTLREDRRAAPPAADGAIYETWVLGESPRGAGVGAAYGDDLSVGLDLDVVRVLVGASVPGAGVAEDAEAQVAGAVRVEADEREVVIAADPR